MNQSFFTSDHHFGHASIIKNANRPFTSVEEMDETLIQRWNEKVKSTDSVYYLGDLGLCRAERLKEILKQLNGNIYLVKGNHDDSAMSCKNRFEWVKDYYELKIPNDSVIGGKQRLILFHYAIRQWNYKRQGAYHLFGHSHGKLVDNPNELSMDVGVDCHHFYPISFEEVNAKMEGKKNAME